MEKFLKKFVKHELIDMLLILCKEPENYSKIVQFHISELKQLSKTQNP